MELELTLMEANTMSPCGVFGDLEELPTLISKAHRFPDHLFVKFDSAFAVYCPSQPEPDLPYLGPKTEYFCRYTNGIYGPSTMRLNAPNQFIGALRKRLVTDFALEGELLFSKKGDFSIFDLSRAQKVSNVDFKKLI
jgi:hypothetical protein